jgi:hypothetical protein
MRLLLIMGMLVFALTCRGQKLPALILPGMDRDEVLRLLKEPKAVLSGAIEGNVVVSGQSGLVTVFLTSGRVRTVLYSWDRSATGESTYGVFRTLRNDLARRSECAMVTLRVGGNILLGEASLGQFPGGDVLVVQYVEESVCYELTFVTEDMSRAENGGEFLRLVIQRVNETADADALGQP